MNSLTKKIVQLTTYLFLLVGLVTLSACGGGSVEQGQRLLTCDLPLIPSADGKSCVEKPPIFCPDGLVPNEANDGCVAPVDPNAPVPTVFAGVNEAILFYNRVNDANNEPGDPVYDGYRLHTWNNETCDAYEPESVAVAWENGLVPNGIDPAYGAYWILKLKEGYTDCGNFIIHIGTDDAGKELGGGDWMINLAENDPNYSRMSWTLSGVAEVFETPILSLGDLPLQISDFAAHWIDTNTLVWNVDTAVATEFRLHYSLTAGIEADTDSNLNAMALTLTETTLTAEQLEAFPIFGTWAAFSGDWTAEEAKSVLKGQLVIAAYDADGPFLATRVQTAKALDAIYTGGETDADEAQLGVVYDGDNVSVSVWAPTAQDVTLYLYNAEKVLVRSETMTEDTSTGIWNYSATDLDRMFYRFGLTVYHPQNDAIESIRTSDPYSVSLSTNGIFSQFVNLNDADLKPTGWEAHSIPTIVDPEDAVIYEGHIRDFSVSDDSTTEMNRGKYMAFTETDSVPMQHLSSLAQSGLTHFHMLPANDIATIKEDIASVVNLNDTVDDLCALDPDAVVCEQEPGDVVLKDLLESYSPSSPDAQALVNVIRSHDSFNWGYDPKHFNVPDGSYATNADGVTRILEMRAMNQALHETGLRVVLDVVYNHTNSSGLYENSVFDKIVPGYYHRRELESGNVLRSTCCDDTALEHRMMDKFMNDSLALWTEHYKFDGFRFDIMSQGSTDQMVTAREKIRAIDPDNYFYGEGWFRSDGRTDQANQDNMAGTEISTFNDRLRDAVRGKLPQVANASDAALFSGTDDARAMNQQDIIKLGMAGTLANFILESASGIDTAGSSFNPSAYALDPADVVNYVSKHDDPALWDQLQFNLPFAMSLEDRVRSQNIAIAIPLMSQGVPFLQIGGDMLRSKSLDRDSFDAGDWFNRVDFTMQTNNWNVGLPLEEKNGDRWYTDPDKPWLLSVNALSNSPLTQVSASDVMFASSVFKEFLSIRRDSKLFRLTTEADIIARVGFHNIGNRQQQGVIVMSIDDGVGLVDLDPANDAIVVMINGSDEERSHTVPTASEFVLHPTLAASVDTRVAGASFAAGTDEGTFTVPAKTMAVFVRLQGAEQGEGLAATATSGAPDLVPYGDTAVYLRGGMNEWGLTDVFEYKGDGVYNVEVALTGEQAYEFKVASEDWATVNLGAIEEGTAQDVVEGEDKTLAASNFNLKFTAPGDASYVFSLDATDSNSPILNVINAAATYAGTPVFIRGGMNEWGTTDELIFDGVDSYVVDIPLTASPDAIGFKVASADWATVNLGAEDSSSTVVDLGVAKSLFTTNDNLSLTISADGTYRFTVSGQDIDTPQVTVEQVVQ